MSVNIEKMQYPTLRTPAYDSELITYWFCRRRHLDFVVAANNISWSSDIQIDDVMSKCCFTFAFEI